MKTTEHPENTELLLLATSIHLGWNIACALVEDLSPAQAGSAFSVYLESHRPGLVGTESLHPRIGFCRHGSDLEFGSRIPLATREREVVSAGFIAGEARSVILSRLISSARRIAFAEQIGQVARISAIRVL